MLCADCKRKFPKWKTNVRANSLCLPCQQKKRRKIQVAAGKRPNIEPVNTWKEYVREVEEEKLNSEKEALLAWLEH